MTLSSPLLLIIGLSVLGVMADASIKLATSQARGIASAWFIFGLLTYAIVAFGWFSVLKHTSLSAVGITYAVCTSLLLVASGITCFHERLTIPECVGLAFGLAAICLLRRFA